MWPDSEDGGVRRHSGNAFETEEEQFAWMVVVGDYRLKN